MGNLWILLKISFTSIFSHKVKSGIVGAIMLFGTFLVVIGTGLLDSIELAMEESVTSSLSGHLQIHSAESKDELALIGGMGGADADIGEIEDYAKLKEVVEGVDNVRVTVPMGLGTAISSAQSELELTLGELRVAVNEGRKADIVALVARVRQILDVYGKELDNKLAVQAESDKLREEREIVDRASSEAFWKEFDADPLAGLDYLDGKAAPLLGNGRMMFFRYIGTDVQLFAKSFDRFKIVKGEMIPEGRRGFLISETMYDRMVKHPTARQFDEIYEAVTESGRVIATDEALENQVERMSRQYSRVIFQLRPDDARRLEKELRAMLPAEKGDLAALLQSFLKVDDGNLEVRYRYFYDTIGKMIRLYAVNVGEVITLRGFTRSGFLKAVNLKFYGTFAFEGLETSDLAGVMNIVDMLTFRELYGKMSAAQKAELKDLSASVDRKDVKREDAEDALFGGGDLVEEQDENSDAMRRLNAIDTRTLEIDQSTTELPYTQEEIDRGMALNVAVILDDPERLQETREEIVAATKAAGLNMNVLDWQQASGLLGQFVIVIRLVLWTAILIIFTVALVIINNSMVMATMDRTPEIGTMRALGAQRSFVLSMFMIETMLLGLVSGGLGALLGAGAVGWMGSVGIPAGNEVVVFIFGGPRLYPEVGLSNLVSAMILIIVVSLGSTFYPAMLATRIQPIEAMRSK